MSDANIKTAAEPANLEKYNLIRNTQPDQNRGNRSHKHDATKESVWYYLDAMILIRLDKENLIDTLKVHKKLTRSRFLITTTISNELGSKNKSEHVMSASFYAAIRDNVVEVEDVSKLGSKYSLDMMRTKFPTIQDGEASLLGLIQSGHDKHPSVERILVTNDIKTLKITSQISMKTQTITDYVIWLVENQIVDCKRALVMLEESLSRISEYRNP